MDELRTDVVFMAWKLATSFVLTAQVWFEPEFKYGDEDALLGKDRVSAW